MIATGMANQVNFQFHFPEIFINKHTATRMFTMVTHVCQPRAIASSPPSYCSVSLPIHTSVPVACSPHRMHCTTKICSP